MKREKNTEAEVKKGGGVDWVSIDTMGGSTGETHGDGVRGETPHWRVHPFRLSGRLVGGKGGWIRGRTLMDGGCKVQPSVSSDLTYGEVLRGGSPDSAGDRKG